MDHTSSWLSSKQGALRCLHYVTTSWRTSIDSFATSRSLKVQASCVLQCLIDMRESTASMGCKRCGLTVRWSRTR